ncbi:putative methyltransferase [Thermodesulfobacterium sp. TA1]|uniref:bis-aminopropyl spermidine synthase family protein n=1 Tax=Thermodesulfobacterium sp. TA1 TaxID=2234087 RepID=UPI001231B24C|nr:bis-aminopropyl spermidine synthase family protein [Thermodesulfobacterium sp. TA1]QER42411.1 putative methyltransferase [Thermodesulfobacterium sp. TA1]
MKNLERIKRQILRTLAKDKASFWELVNYQDAHLVDFLEAIKQLLEDGTIKYEKPYFYLAVGSLQILPYQSPGCLFCSPFEQNPFWKQILERFIEITKDRPLPTSDFDQGFIFPKDTVKRTAFIYERGDLEGAEVFILGDDDLISLSMALTKLPKKIVVVEIDERINQFIKEKAQLIGYSNIEVYSYNVIEKLPSELYQKFDVFVTDPVETQKGLKLFVYRCIQALKGEGSAGYIGFTHREASLNKWYDFQRFILDSGFVLTDILRDFTTYPEEENQWEDFYRTYRIMKEFDLSMPDVDWYKSCFIRFEAVEKPKVLNIEVPSNVEELYFDDESWATPLPSYLEKNIKEG